MVEIVVICGVSLYPEEVSFDREVEEGFEKAKELRDNVLAHSNKTWFDFGRPPNKLPEQGNVVIDLSELRDLSDALESLYMALILGNHRGGLPLKYETPIYTRPSHNPGRYYLREDIDAVLNSIAENSRVWNTPEESPEALARLSNEQIAKLDAYRQKLGKPKITLTQEQYDAINANFGWGREPKLPSTYLQ